MNIDAFLDYSLLDSMINRTMEKSIDTAAEIRSRILEASRKRFALYGYGKTTMAEIANDCRMSAANLYRFFENKQDIGAGLARQCWAEDENTLRAAVTRTDLSAAEKIELFVAETLRHAYEQWSQQPKLDELVQMMSSERADLMHAHQTTKREMLIGLLAEGVAAGEFDVPDPATTADAILFAIIAFDVPFFMHLYSQDTWRAMAHNVAQLILRGVHKW